MGITRKWLKGMGLSDEQVDSIVEAHTETTDGLKDKLKAAEKAADELPAVKKELEQLKAQGDGGYKEKYEKEHADFETFKKTVTEKETQAKRENAARNYFQGKNITGANLDIAMRAAAAEISALELDGDNIKDTATLDALTAGTLAGLIKTSTTVGANVAHPPANGSGTNLLTMSEIYKRDEHGKYVLSTEERQKAIAANLANKGV